MDAINHGELGTNSRGVARGQGPEEDDKRTSAEIAYYEYYDSVSLNLHETFPFLFCFSV